MKPAAIERSGTSISSWPKRLRNWAHGCNKLSANENERRNGVKLARVTLEDKYTLQSGRIYLSGIQALVRLPMLQRARDRAARLNTAGFISGYRGSPLGGYDNALWQARPLLE